MNQEQYGTPEMQHLQYLMEHPEISDEFAKWQDKDFCKLHSFTGSIADSENCKDCLEEHKKNCAGCAKCEV